MVFHHEMKERSRRFETGSGELRWSFGNETRLREQAREAWCWTWIDRLLQDLNYAARMLARSPGFTAMVVLVLTIGVGVNVSAFSLFDMIALQPLPVRDPNALVRLERRSPEASTSEMAYPSFVFYREHAEDIVGCNGRSRHPSDADGSGHRAGRDFICHIELLHRVGDARSLRTFAGVLA